MPKKDIPKSVRCSFCGKSQENVKKIVAGPGVYICDECVDLCASIIEAEMYEDEDVGYTLAENIPSPLIATYYKTKTYIIRLTEAIRIELEKLNTNVSIKNLYT